MHGTFDRGDIRIRFWLSGFDGAPERVSDLLGLDADRIVRRGQCFPPPHDARDRADGDYWGLETGSVPATPRSGHVALDELLQPLREAFAGRQDRFAALAGCTARIDIAIAGDGPLPSVGFAPGDLDFLDGTGLAVSLGIRSVAADAVARADIAIPAFPRSRPVDIRELAPA